MGLPTHSSPGPLTCLLGLETKWCPLTLFPDTHGSYLTSIHTFTNHFDFSLVSPGQVPGTFLCLLPLGPCGLLPTGVLGAAFQEVNRIQAWHHSIPYPQPLEAFPLRSETDMPFHSPLGIRSLAVPQSLQAYSNPLLGENI